MIRDRILKEDIEKWLGKLKAELKCIKSVDDNAKRLLDNIYAYVNDTEHFLMEGDYVLAWEAISFAWGLLEAGVDVSVLKRV